MGKENKLKEIFSSDVKFTPLRWFLFIGAILIGWVIKRFVFLNKSAAVTGFLSGFIGVMMYIIFYYQDKKK